MKNDILSITIVTIIYLIVWFLIIKIRNSRCEIIKDFDNGNDFYESLSELDKENYWKEDTKVLNIFFLILLFFFRTRHVFTFYRKQNVVSVFDYRNCNFRYYWYYFKY